MWMQKSVEGASFSSSGNFPDRHRFGTPQYAQGSSYGGRGVPVETGDWKTKILESGQWLGGKVIEYGGKLARGPTTDAVPDQYGHQMPRNDGRANWMADIRSSSSSSSYAGGSGGLGGVTGGYQNDFATERPQMYSDLKMRYSSHSLDSQADGGFESKRRHEKNRQAKKKQEGKKSKKKQKKKRKSDKTRPSESEAESESEELAVSESSEVESAADQRRHKTHGTTKKKKGTKTRGESFYSEESASDSDQDQGKRKASTDYSFSFDPAKLPPPPPNDEQKVTTKKTKVKKGKDKAGKKARSWQHSVVSTDDESKSEKETLRKAKKRSSKKAGAAASCVSVDLLGVDLDVQPVAQPPTSGRPAHEMRLSVFDAPQTPLQDLAGLSFAAPVQGPAPTQPSVFDGSASAPASNEARVHFPLQNDAFRTNLLPENNLVDLSSLVREKKKTLSANPAEKRTLNDMQKARGMNQPTPVMVMPMQGQQQQTSMMKLNMNQLQITNGATELQQQMYPNLPMQHMAMTTHPQLMSIQPTHSQQFVQGSMATAEPPRAANFTSSDPFRQAFMK